MKIDEVIKYMEAWAPEYSQEDWDKSGLQVYMGEEEIRGVLVAMDLTREVFDRARDLGANLIITHHPFFFSPLDSLREDSYQGSLLMDMVREGVSAYAAHTNLDKAPDGVNDQWIGLLGLEGVSPLDEEEGMGLVGTADWTLQELDSLFGDMGIKHIRYYGRRREAFSRIAFVGGAGSSYLAQAQEAGADILITGDVKYHEGQAAYEAGMVMVDIGHFESERPILNRIKVRLEEAYPGLDVQVHDRSDFHFEIA